MHVLTDYNDGGIMIVNQKDDFSADGVALNENFMALADAVFTDDEALIQVMTRAEWTAANPTLSAGVIGVESDTSLYKIGDGSTAWNAPLPYGGARHADSGGVCENRGFRQGRLTAAFSGRRAACGGMAARGRGTAAAAS
jgi:hypothetical protein